MMLHKEAGDIVRAFDVLIIGEMVHDPPPGCNLKNSSPPIQVATSRKDKCEPGRRRQQINRARMQDNQILISAYDEILKARRFVATAE
jgi:hypothetical protein